MLSFREKYSYGIGALGKDLACSIVFVYVMFYFTDIVGISPIFAGSILMVARFWDAINDTFMGIVVDNTRSKWGKFRPWILVGTVINAVFIILLFRQPDFNPSQTAIYFGIVYILWGMTYTIMDIPYWSMLPSLSDSIQERNQIAVIPRIFASMAWLIMGTFGLQIVNILGNVGDKDGVLKAAAQSKGFYYFAIGIAVIFVICSIITVMNVKERTNSKTPQDKTSFKKAIEVIRKNDQLIAFIGILLVFNLVMQLSGGVSLYYFKYVIGNEGFFALYSAFTGLAEISGLMLFPFISKRLDRTKVYGIACTLPVIGMIFLWVTGVMFPEAGAFVALSGIIFKLGCGLALGASTVMLADVVDYGEYKLKSRNESVIFSIQTMLVKFASAISGWMIGVGLTIVGFVANAEPTQSTIVGIRVLMIGAPIVLCILSFIIFFKFFKIKGAFHNDMLKELSLRKGIEATNQKV